MVSRLKLNKHIWLLRKFANHYIMGKFYKSLMNNSGLHYSMYLCILFYHTEVLFTTKFYPNMQLIAKSKLERTQMHLQNFVNFSRGSCLNKGKYNI